MAPKVLLLDKAHPGSGVTGNSFAWIGRPRVADVQDASTPLRRRVLAEYRRLEQEVSGVHVHWRRSLLWTEKEREDSRPLGPDERLVDTLSASPGWSRTCGDHRRGPCAWTAMERSTRSR